MSTENLPGVSRRAFLTTAGLAGAGLVGATLLAGCGGSSSNSTNNGGDNQIIGVALVAEALAVTTYTNIINSAIFKTSLAGNTNDQAYLTAAQQEEQVHLNELAAAVGTGPATTTFYYPVGMFTSAQVTLNTLVTLEEAFIAAYIIGVDQFSTAALRVLASRILGVESEHRALARVIAADLGLTTVTGLSGQAQNVVPANNLGFEQTFLLASITNAQIDLNPFTNLTSASAAGYSTTPYTYTAVNVSGSPYDNINS